MKYHAIVSSKRIMGGVPCIVGTRLPVILLLDWVAEEKTLDAFIELYPYLKRETLIDVIGEASRTFEHRMPE